MVRRVVAILLLSIVVVGVGLFMVLPKILRHYDSEARLAAAEMVKRELPTGASMIDMEAFMKRHTKAYGFDEDHQLAGFLLQSKSDQRMFDRKILVTLRLNQAAQSFDEASIETFYTFL